MCLPSQLQGEAKNKKAVVQAGLGKKLDPVSQITKAKWARVVAQM
jgi:hypothetical protein